MKNCILLFVALVAACAFAGNVQKGSFTDPRDGQVYKTVKISDQIWMAENLNYDYNMGTAKSYCYNDEAANCEKYGRLYTWAAAMDSAAKFSNAGKGCGYGEKYNPKKYSPRKIRGICPEGWHLPSDAEWETLFTAVGGKYVAGTKLKSSNGWNNGYDKTTGNGTDEYGFSVLPAGDRGTSGLYYDIGCRAFFLEFFRG